jgi:phosphoenolpyruvate carboxykinase (GTP)
MAMRPFCGYNMADYWTHWLSFGKKSDKLPKIFHVNWFRQDRNGKFMWPGFGQNLRVLKWVIEQCEGTGKNVNTAIGTMPAPVAIDTSGLNLGPDTMKELTEVNVEQWKKEMGAVTEFFETFGDRVPQELYAEQKKIIADLG